jgi:hypothetical protein
MEVLRIDLTDSQLDRFSRVSRTDNTPDAPAVEIAQMAVTGNPVYFEKAPVEVNLAATGVRATMETTEGHGSLVLKSATSGTVSIRTSREALEALLNSFAVEAAAKQGFEVRKTVLTFTQEGPRAVAFRAEVTAKVFIMTASLALTGRLTIDDSLNAKLSNLALDGDGMILKLAGSYAKPHLDLQEGRVFALAAFTPGGLRLRDAAITAGDSLHIRADFGAA